MYATSRVKGNAWARHKDFIVKERLLSCFNEACGRKKASRLLSFAGSSVEKWMLVGYRSERLRQHLAENGQD